MIKTIFRPVVVATIVLTSGLYRGEAAEENQSIKVACVGDSITFGAYIKDRQHFSYPSQLSVMLGDQYQVRNFGVSGRTLLKKGDLPYWALGTYKQAQKWNPDIVIIKLGTNDTKLYNWKYKDELEPDLSEMVTTFINLPSKPKVFVSLPVPSWQKGDGINGDRVKNGVIPVVKKVATKFNLPIIDFYSPMLDKSNLFADGVHPQAPGAFILAATAYNAITGKTHKGDFTTMQKKIQSNPLPTTHTDWHGFRHYNFKVGKVNCQLVKPEVAAPGNPWVWRARFFGHEPQADIALLKKGYHIGYCDVSELFGSPTAVTRWNEFYKFATTKLKLNKKPALEGMSRGGLIIFNWAAANPDKVAAIYGDAPVCDITSWPGGLGTGDGWKAGWPTCKKLYGLTTDDDAKAFQGNPIDKAADIAKAGIPVLIVYGKADKVVPPAENCLLFAERFKKAGGSIKLIGKDNCGHHPHSLKDPAPIVEFITTNQPK
jgi:pimeloyl-ACP methyl ester carboxylesterase/lysophospholipase L1-like esterase